MISPVPPRLHPRLRVVDGDTILIGPGKAELLETIARLGTLRDAAAEMEMSYTRAWSLVKTMNEAFREPLIEMTRGGKEGGTATLTKTGVSVLKIYRQMEKESNRATRESWKKMQALIRK